MRWAVLAGSIISSPVRQLSSLSSIGVSVNQESLTTSRAGYSKSGRCNIRVGGVLEIQSSQATTSDVSGVITTVELDGARVGEHLSVQVVDLVVGSPAIVRESGGTAFRSHDLTAACRALVASIQGVFDYDSASADSVDVVGVEWIGTGGDGISVHSIAVDLDGVIENWTCELDGNSGPRSIVEIGDIAIAGCHRDCLVQTCSGRESGDRSGRDVALEKRTGGSVHATGDKQLHKELESVRKVSAILERSCECTEQTVASSNSGGRLGRTDGSRSAEESSNESSSDRVSTRNKLLTVDSCTADEWSCVELVASSGRVQVSKICGIKRGSPGHANSIETVVAIESVLDTIAIGRGPVDVLIDCSSGAIGYVHGD